VSISFCIAASSGGDEHEQHADGGAAAGEHEGLTGRGRDELEGLVRRGVLDAVRAWW
jgi:hypothetical protein